MRTYGFFVLVAVILFGCASVNPKEASLSPSDSDPSAPGGYFGWPFLPAEAMQPRGGLTRGAPVDLLETESTGFQRWRATKGASAEARDRAAIAAMEGQFRVSFQFVELAGLTKSYTPAAPYFSWGTEHVQILEEREGFISLQHTLVMYMRGEDDSVEGPFVMKHWRQDWTYQDPVVLEFSPPNSWSPQNVVPVEGRWTQAVYQVDDSPRYELSGRWVHFGDGAQFESQPVDRPLPRREFSVRNDYDVLQSGFRITLSPDGWVHETFSRKIDTRGEDRRVLATESGVNRYEHISSPDLAGPAISYWEKTRPYWQAVRNEWNVLLESGTPFRVRAIVDDKKLWQHHFEKAGELESGAASIEDSLVHAAQTVRAFVVQLGDETGDEPPDDDRRAEESLY